MAYTLLLLLFVCPLAAFAQFAFPINGAGDPGMPPMPSTTRPPVGGAGRGSFGNNNGFGGVGFGVGGAGSAATGGTSGVGAGAAGAGSQAGGGGPGGVGGASGTVDDASGTVDDIGNDDDNDDNSGSGSGAGGPGDGSYSYEYGGGPMGPGLLSSAGQKAGFSIACLVVVGVLVAGAMFIFYKRQQKNRAAVGRV